MSALVQDLTTATSLSLVGGKALALGVMLQHDFPVPPGFVVTTAAFNQLSPQLEQEVFTHFDMLNTLFVAVRSSAVGEDSTGAAWAGQLDTFLNVTRSELTQKITACWQSVESQRAQAYAKEKSLKAGAVGVIVQAMIQSETSGVAFSQHPVTGDTKQILIEAGFGLGEAIVSGEVTPDTYITNKSSHDILSIHIASQTKQLVKNTLGHTEWQPVSNSAAQKLSDTHIRELSALVGRLETFFGHPVDVEWAVFHNTLYIMQSRAITTT